MIYDNIASLLGNTPVIKYENIFLKLEGYNPGGSIKDRIAFYMIKEHEKNGDIKKGDTLITATSGNTGIGLCLAGTQLGYNVIIVMPENMSIERIKMMRAYGGEVILTDAKSGMSFANSYASQLASEKGYKLLDQFSDKFNPLAHEETAKEIIRDFPSLDYLVAGIGTGGTISGLAKFLKPHYPNLKIIGIEPLESPIITKGEKGAHQIQGIGAGFIPSVLDLTLVDKVETVKSSDALQEMEKLGKNGLFLGVSSAAAALVAKEYASKNIGKTVLAISPDSGLKYLSVVK